MLSLHATWLGATDPFALGGASPVPGVAHQPVLRAAQWVQFGELRALELSQTPGLLLMLQGQELMYWDEQATHLMLPGVPGLLAVEADSRPSCPLQPDSWPPYQALSGLIAVRDVPPLMGLCVPQDRFGFLLIVTEFNPRPVESACG